MKIKFTLFLLSIFILSNSFSQSTTARFKGTIKKGTENNAVILEITPNETFTGKITNFQFVVQVPNTVSPMPEVSIKNNPLSTYVPTTNYLNEVSNEAGFYNYLFAVAPPAGQPGYSFTANTPINALELQFNNGPSTITSNIRFAQLANGGSSSQKNFYVEVSGNDNTNTSAMFYGTGASNNSAGYAGYSYATISGVALPLHLLNFSVLKQNNNALINWKVTSEENIDFYEVQRSTNGAEFTTLSNIGKAAINGGNTYNYTDKGINSLISDIVYYRIKQVDKSGTFTYTDVRLLRLDLTAKVSVFPNPAKQGFYVMVPLKNTDSKIQLNLLNATGQLLESKVISARQAANYYFKINSPVITTGTYLLKILKNNELIESKQIIIRP